MPNESSCWRRITTLVALALVLAASACSGGVRPTLTADRIEDSAALNPAIRAADPTTATGETTADSISSATATESAAPLPAGEDPALVVEQLTVEVIESFPHDDTAFTQGLELDNGTFIESTGLAGESTLRRVEPTTGEVLQQIPTPNNYFAEGLTKVGDELIQLTWTENTAFFWDATTFELVKEVSYEGEGWGLCYDGSRLVMTDGKPELIFRDPTTFAEIGRMRVTYNGQDVFNLNEVECVDGVVWANMWQSDLIMRINPDSGEVTALVDASSLDRPSQAGGAVLNGIAWDATTQSFYVTGKLWPTMYRVNFVPAAG